MNGNANDGGVAPPAPAPVTAGQRSAMLSYFQRNGQGQDTARRLQIGIGALVAVLLLVGLASIISTNGAGSDPAAVAAGTVPADGAAPPLVELGVEAGGAPAAPGAAPLPQIAPPAPPPVAVPDLDPDPVLKNGGAAN